MSPVSKPVQASIASWGGTPAGEDSLGGGYAPRTSVLASRGRMRTVVRFASGSCVVSSVPYSSSETIHERSNLTTASIISTNVPSFNFPT